MLTMAAAFVEKRQGKAVCIVTVLPTMADGNTEYDSLVSVS